MNDEDVKRVIQGVVLGLQPTFLTMLKESEARIDRTNEIVEKLQGTCKDMMEIYDKHLTSLEHSRDQLIENNYKLVENNGTLLKEVENLRKELLGAKKDYHKLFDSFLDMSRNQGGGARAEISVVK